MQVLKEEVKERIVQSALAEFLEWGFQNASMRRIAKGAQISVSNIYKYFMNKENLFHLVTAPAFAHINNILRKQIYYEVERGFIGDQFELIAQLFTELVIKHRREILLIMDRSQGTKYEKFKDDVIGKLESRFRNNIDNTKLGSKEEKDVMHLVSSNIIESLLQVSRNYKSDKWVASIIRGYLKYHIGGVSSFY